jgi:hypothetical protein
MHDMGEKLMNRSRSTGVLLVGWGRGSGGLPFPDPLYYYQVDFIPLTSTVGDRLMNRSRSTGVLPVDGVAGVYPSLTRSTIIR